MGSKQEELEALVRQKNDNVVAITETQWNDSHKCSATLDDCKLFRRNRQGRRRDEVAMYVREGFDCTELSEGDDRLSMGENQGQQGRHPGEGVLQTTQPR